MENLELIEKNFDPDKLEYGGALYPEQQDQFFVYVKRFSTVLEKCRFVRMTQSKQTIEKMHISEPVTEAIEPNTTSANTANGVFDHIELNAKKLRSAYNVPTETFRNNIEKETFEDTLFETITARITTDMELLAFQGDASITTPANPTERLLMRADGWDKITENAHIVDAAGANVSLDLFSKIHRNLPSGFRNDPNLHWVMSDIIANDWTNALAQRLSNAGDAAIGGNPLRPLGKPMLVAPLLPSDKPLDTDAATPGEVVGTRHGPFQIETGVNDTFVVNISAGGARTITIPAGVHETTVIANIINGVFGTNSDLATAYDDGEGRLAIRNTTTGAAVNVVLTAANSLTTFGMSVGTYAGTDAGTIGQLKEGSFILLCNLQGLIFGLVEKTRFYSKFNPDYDRYESRMYNEVAIDVESVDAISKGINIRKISL